MVPPTTVEGDPLPRERIARHEVHCDQGSTLSLPGDRTFTLDGPPVAIDIELKTHHANTNALPAGQWTCAVTATDTEEQESAPSAPITFRILASSASLDVDGNGTRDALTDGLLVLRYLFALRGASLVDGVVGAGATRTTSTAIETYLRQHELAMLDVDGNGAADALTDGLLALRYLFTLRGESLTDDAIGPNAVRGSAEEVEAFATAIVNGAPPNPD